MKTTGLLHRVVWLKFTDVSQMLAASIALMMGQRATEKRQ
jgi:hypothetical protein